MTENEERIKNDIYRKNKWLKELINLVTQKSRIERRIEKLKGYLEMGVNFYENK